MNIGNINQIERTICTRTVIVVAIAVVCVRVVNKSNFTLPDRQQSIATKAQLRQIYIKIFMPGIQ